MLLLRGAIHREIQQFLVSIISFWTSMAKTASKNGIVDLAKIDDINKFFNRDSLLLISACIRFSEESNTIDINKKYINWYTEIMYRLEEINIKGNRILNRYNNSMRTEIFYKLFYLINESIMVGNLSKAVEAATKSYGKNLLLAQCMSFGSEVGGEQIDKTCKIIIDLYNWINSEYKYIVSNIEENIIMINNIEFAKFLKN